jgi:exodeoxyribonuclease V beta subunit
LRQWVPIVVDNGVGALFERVQADMRVQERLLHQPDGERLLTDLRHLAEILHEEQTHNALGLAGLASWLRRRRRDHDDAAIERSRRLESDAAAVQVLTSHMSKGLEFPVVLAPSLWDHRPRPQTYPRFHDHDERLRDVGGPSSPDHAAHVQANKEEDANEELRVAYVTLTRAAALVIAWWAPTQNSSSGPLTRMLLHNDPTRVAPFSMPVPSDRDVLAQAEDRANASGDTLQVSTIASQTQSSPPRWVAPAPDAAELQLASFDRPLDQGWRRTSYTALAQHPTQAHTIARPFVDDLDAALKNDEQDVAGTSLLPAPAEDPNAHLRPLPSLWETLSGGSGFGILVHRVLEGYEPECDLAELIRSLSPGYRHTPALSDALQHALDTPLHPLLDSSWSAVNANDLIREVAFELPLAGGDVPHSATVTLAGLVDLWRLHVPDGVLAGYADTLARLATEDAAHTLRGYLTGSIDALLRTRADTATDEQYVIVDYKTNRLAPRDEPLTVWHYRHTAMETAMIAAHYPLQAVLYSVALHRYLRWRRPGYCPERHLGGVLYLFLRGMSGMNPLDHA